MTNLSKFRLGTPGGKYAHEYRMPLFDGWKLSKSVLQLLWPIMEKRGI